MQITIFKWSDENNVSQATQTPNRHQRICNSKKDLPTGREAAVLIILAVSSGVIERIPENVLRKREEPGFFGGFPILHGRGFQTN